MLIKCLSSVNQGANGVSIKGQLRVLIDDICLHLTEDVISTHGPFILGIIVAAQYC